MSALGQKQTCAVQQPMSTLPLKAEHHNIRLRLETEHRDLLDLQRSREAALCSSVEICPFLALSDQGSDPDRNAWFEAGRITLQIEAQAERIAIVIANGTLGLPSRERAQRAQLGDQSWRLLRRA